jgi:hypothetical protein
MALFGAESESVEKTLLKVQSAMALSQGLQTIGESVDSFKQLGAVVKSLNIVQVANNFIQTGTIALKKADVVATAEQATATVAATAATSGATTGMKLLRLAIIGTGIGALVVGLIALYQNFDKVKEVVLKFIPGLASVGKFIGGIIDSVTDFVGVTSDASRALDAMREAADKSLALNKKYLEQQGDQLDEFTKKKIDAKNRYLEALKEEGNSEKDLVELAKRLNRELAAADKEREDEKLKKKKEAKDKLDAIEQKNADDAIAAAKKEAEELLKIQQEFAQKYRDLQIEQGYKAQDDVEAARKANADALLSEQELAIKNENDAYKIKYDNAVKAGYDTEELEIQNLNNLNDIKLKFQNQDYENQKASSDAKIELEKKEAEATEEIEKRKQAARQQYLAAGANTLKQAASLLGEATGAGKALAIAATTIDTYQSATAAYKSLAGIPVVGPALGGIAAGVAVASGLANVKKILSVKVPGGGGGGGNVPSGGGAPSAPQFNVVGNSGVNQLAGIMATNENTPVKTYVVAQDVTSGQSLDRNIIRNASLG